MPSMSDLNDRGIMSRTPTGPRQIIYGQSKVSGPIVYLATSGTKNEYLHLVVALAGHEVQEIGDVYFNEDLVLTGSGDGYATGKYAAFTGYDGSLIHKHLGTTTQTVDTTLQTDFPTDWDSNHRLRGIAYIYCKLTFSNEIFVGGIPNISCVIKGKKVYNPDTLTTAYSANPALCLRDYLTDADLGMGMDTSEIDDTSVIAAAAICVEQVEIKPVTTPATNENRYECNGQVVTSSTPDSIIGQILSAMAGTIAYSGGQVVVYAAAYRAPSLTLDETHMAGAFTVSTRTSARDRVNAVKGTYISEANQWTAADFPQITSATYLAADDGVYHWRDVILPFTTSSSAAQRIAVINLRQAREEIIFTAKFNLTAMQLRAGDTVMLTNANLGFSAKEFQVIAWSLASDGTPPTPVIELQLRETASSIYDWNVTDEIAVEGAPNTTLPSPFSIVAPTNLTLTADGTTQLIQADGTAIPRIRVVWSAPSSQFVQSGGKTVIEYKEDTATTYLTWSTVDGDQTLDFISSDVRIGTRYNVRLFAQSFFNTSSTYTATSSITVAKDTTAPAIPTSLTASVGTGKAVSLDWADNTEADFSEYGVYRKTTAVTPADANTSKIAELRSSRFVDTEVDIGTTYFYWVNAYDALENVSGFANYVQAIPTTVTAGADPTAPSTPSAPTFSSETNYLSSDGTSFARITITVPAVPAGGVGLNVLYKVSGSSSFIIASQVDAAGAVSIDDLTPGVAYVFAVQAFSFNAILSTISSTLSRTAPSKSSAPAAPSAVTYVGGAAANYGRAPNMFSGVVQRSIRMNWTSSADKDVAYYQWVNPGADTDAAADAATKNDTTLTEVIIALSIWATGFFRVRAVDRTGNFSAWAGGGTNLDGVAGYPAGTMTNQNATLVTITGGSTIGQSAVGATNFFANDASSGISGATTAVDVKDANFRVFSGTTQKLRIDYTNGEVYIQSSRVLSTRKTGWSTATGTATRTTFATSTVTTEQLAERVKALIDDLDSTAGHGLIGT
jgi:hypothetical protein